MWQDRAKTLAEIAKFSQRDAEAYPEVRRPPGTPRRGRRIPAAHHSPALSAQGVGDFLEYLKLAGRMRVFKQEIVGLVKIFTQSASDFLDEWFESEELKVTLATDGVIGANGGPRSPGTAYILLHHCMGGVNGHRGLWGFVRGGMGAVSNAIADSARSHGANIRINAPVEKILVRERPRVTASFCRMATRSKPKSSPAISTRSRTFLKLLDPADLDPGLPRFHPQVPLRRNLAQDESRP